MEMYHLPTMPAIARSLLVLLFLAGSGNAYCASPLRFCYEDVAQPPWTMPDGSGVTLDLLRRVQQRQNENFELLPMPWKRCIEEVRIGTMDAMDASADTPERREFSMVPTLPDGRGDPSAALMTENFNLYFRIGSGVTWDGQTLVVPHGPVITPRGYYVAALLQQRGFTVSESAKSSEDGLRMLAQGSADAALLQGREAELTCANDPRFRNLVAEARIPYAVLPLYLMVGRKVFDADPKRINRIWNDIRAVLASAEYKKIEAMALKRTSGKP